MVLTPQDNGFNPILQVDGVDPRNYFMAKQRGYSLQDDLTITDVRWLGEHTVKGGIKFKDVKLAYRDAATAPLYSYYVGPGGVEANPFQVVFGAQADAAQSTVSTSKNRQFGIYLQDDWDIDGHWLVSLGVRYDYEQTPTYTNYVTPQRFVAALYGIDTNNDPDTYTFNGKYRGAAPGQTYAQTLAKAGIKPMMATTRGSRTSALRTRTMPMLGAGSEGMASWSGSAGRAGSRATMTGH